MHRDIVVVLGTRPEAIKLAPVILELRTCPEFTVWVCNTEQQKELSNQTLAFFGIQPDYTLDIMLPNQTLSITHVRIITALDTLFSKKNFDACIVQGDTMTALCGAISSFYHHIPLFHVEAGLRSFKLSEPFPEEGIRRIIAQIASLHFTPTKNAERALLQENIKADDIHTVGNTVIDSLLCLSQETMKNAEEQLLDYGISLNEKIVLITVHRRENHGIRLQNIIEAIYELSASFREYIFVIPVHPNPNVLYSMYSLLKDIPNIKLIEPLEYPTVVLLMKYARLILTDSGGIQEEAPTFGTPVLVLRYATERSEGVEAGFAHLVGTEKQDIFVAASKILSSSSHKTLEHVKNPYGDGQASQRITNIVKNYWEYES